MSNAPVPELVARFTVTALPKRVGYPAASWRLTVSVAGVPVTVAADPVIPTWVASSSVSKSHAMISAATAPIVLGRLKQKEAEWKKVKTEVTPIWVDVYEKNYNKSLDHRSFYFKQSDKKNFSGKQMVLELKGLVETPDGEGVDPAAAAQAAANAANTVSPFRTWCC